MRHVKRYAKLGRSSAHRRSMLRNLTTQFFIHGYIKTTVSRAKAVQPIIERCITHAIKAHQGNLNSYRKFHEYLHNTITHLKVYHYLADHGEDHQGGRTSLKKLGVLRMGDGAPMALLHLITSPSSQPADTPTPPNNKHSTVIQTEDPEDDKRISSLAEIAEKSADTNSESIASGEPDVENKQNTDISEKTTSDPVAINDEQTAT